MRTCRALTCAQPLLLPIFRTMLGPFVCVGVLLHRFAETQLFLSPDEKHWLAQHPELHLGVIASRLPFEAPPLEREGCALEKE